MFALVCSVVEHCRTSSISLKFVGAKISDFRWRFGEFFWQEGDVAAGFVQYLFLVLNLRIWIERNGFWLGTFDNRVTRHKI